MVEWKPISESFSAMYDLKLELADFSPFNAFTTRKVFPSSKPNSGPAMIQHFSLLGAVKNAFVHLPP
jgi:hypothetical protein